MTPERRSEIETILDHMNYSWTQRESDAIRDLFAEIDRRHEVAPITQRGADGGEGQDEMVTFYDAVADDPEMTPEQKIHWLRTTAADYLEKLEVAETLIKGHQMRYDALVETMQRVGARLEATEHIVALVRELRDECQQNGIGNDDLPLRLMVLFGALTDYDMEAD